MDGMLGHSKVLSSIFKVLNSSSLKRGNIDTLYTFKLTTSLAESFLISNVEVLKIKTSEIQMNNKANKHKKRKDLPA